VLVFCDLSEEFKCYFAIVKNGLCGCWKWLKMGVGTEEFAGGGLSGLDGWCGSCREASDTRRKHFTVFEKFTSSNSSYQIYQAFSLYSILDLILRIL
jgi:hypothetical protein